MGTTLREIIFDIGGGIKGDKKFKVVQTGGPSGGCIPIEYLDTPIDLRTVFWVIQGSVGMGSGGMDCHGRRYMSGRCGKILSSIYG